MTPTPPAVPRRPPERPFTLAMTWHDLLFIHRPVDPGILRALVPPALEIDERDGAAWVGVVPFRMTGVRLRCAPRIPFASRFAELNVRTYVRAGGRAGVYFFSLDAASRLAVRAARLSFRLPYFDARMSVAEAHGGWIAYRSARTHRGAKPAEFFARYRPLGEAAPAAPGSLEEWLTSRYALFTISRRGEALRGDVDHEPFALQPAEARIETETMCAASGLPPAAGEPHLVFARRADVRAWSLVEARSVTALAERDGDTRRGN